MDNRDKSPMFSIIIPAYNAADFIADAIKSVQVQNVNDWELIIIENGSTDDTTATCESFLNDARIKLLHSEKGVSYARNAGINAANGKWLVFLDADDQLLADTLQKYVEIDEECSPDLIIGEYENKRQSYSGKKNIYQDEILKDFLRLSLENPTQKCNTTAVAFRTAVVQHKSSCFDTQIRYAEDSVFFLEILRQSKKVVTVFYPVYRVIYNTQSAVRSGARTLEKEYIPAIHKVKLLLDLDDSDIRNSYYIFILNQLLVILVNDIFARRESVFRQIKDARAAMEIQEYRDAIRLVDLSEAGGIKGIVYRMMKNKNMLGVLLATRIRQRQNKKKVKRFYV